MARRKFSHTWLVAALVTATFALSAVAGAKTELWVFSSPFCPPCQALKPTIATLEKEGYPVRHIDVSQHPAMAAKYNVPKIPCLIMMDNGRELSRQPGGNRSSIQRMFAAAGVKPSKNAHPGWAQESSTPAPALPGVDSRANSAQPRPDEVPSTDQLAAKLLESSVRITVEDATGKSYGTGTIIDTFKQDALIVTCGHLFRGDSNQQQVSPEDFKSQIIIEQFTATPSGVVVKDRTIAQLLYCDLERDVALVAFRPTQPAKVAPVAGSFVEQVHDRVWSVGCDRGADPTVRNSRVTDINRYNGPPNIETSGAPVQGRSGGGLFNSRGELVGVCFAADNEGNEGLYSGLASVHVGLDAIGLQRVYRSGPDTHLMADNRRVPPALGTSNDPLYRFQSPGDNDNTQAFPAPQTDTPAPPASVAPLTQPQPMSQDFSSQERAALQEIARRGVESEVTVIVRPREPGGKSIVLQLDRVSPQFAERLGNLAQ